MYFPKPYEDELMGSLLIRASHHLGLSMRRLATLFDLVDGELPNFIYPSGLAIVAPLCKMNASEFLWKHTLFPYVVWSPGRNSEDVRQGLKFTGKALTATFRHSRTYPRLVDLTLYRKFCPACASQDHRILGETYWHRTHALPGVFTCSVHRIRLQVTRIPMFKRELLNWDFLPQETQGSTPTTPENLQLLHAIADAASSVLRGDYPIFPLGETLREVGCTHKCAAIRLPGFWAGLEAFFGRDFLQQIGVPMTRMGWISWSATTAAGQAGLSQPQLRWILVHMFLSACADQL